jgi:maleylacetate reductase
VIRPFTYQALPMRVAALARALGGDPDPARALWELAGRLGAPRSLRELGMAEEDIPRIAELAVADPYAHPRPVTRDGIEALLWTAWTGAPPPSTAPAVRTRPTERRSRT